MKRKNLKYDSVFPVYFWIPLGLFNLSCMFLFDRYEYSFIHTGGIIAPFVGFLLGFIPKD